MSKLVFANGALVVMVRYLSMKADGAYVFQRRVPKDLSVHYPNQTHIKVYLGRLTPPEAAKRVRQVLGEQEARHAALRAHPTTPLHVAARADTLIEKWRAEATGHVFQGDTEAEKLGDLLDDYLTDTYQDDYYELKADPRFTKDFARALQSLVSPEDFEAYRRIISMREGGVSAPVLSKVLESYLAAKDETFRQKSAGGVKRHVGYVYSSVGDRPLGAYDRESARLVRDAMQAKGLTTTSVRRGLNDIKAVFNHGRLEFDLQALANPFEKLKISAEGDDASVRTAFAVDELQLIAAACRERDDTVAHITAMMIETGARLSEIVGLRTEDVFLDHEVPHIWIRPHKDVGRSIKTTASVRKVPLVGVSLWAAQRSSSGQPWVFSAYAEDHKVKADSASAVINPWIKKVSHTEKTCHSFRHAMVARLVANRVPEDWRQALVGHSTKSIHRLYGGDFPLVQLRDHLISVVLP